MCSDGEPPEFHNVALRIARKRHKCDECINHIEPGEKYEYVSGKWDSWMSDFHTCLRCVAARGWLLDVCSTFLYGGLRYELYEHWDEGRPLRNVGLGMLIVGQRGGWRGWSVERVKRCVQRSVDYIKASPQWSAFHD